MTRETPDVTKTAELFIDCRNTLGEGPLWHPDRGEFFWFDIEGKTLNNANTNGDILNTWNFDEAVAAAAVIDRDNLLIATASKLIRFSIENDTRELVLPLEADNPDTRSNDSRVDPTGGWWIGTMGTNGSKSAGSVYHYREGKLEKLFGGIGIPNATCFSPDATIAYWADTPTNIIQKCAMDPETGKPAGPWSDHINTSDHRGHPDGAVVDSEGYLWSARWGGSCVVRHAPDGSIDQIVEVPAPNVTCPAFGGPDLKTMYITTARAGMSAEQLEKYPHAGSVFSIQLDVAGQAETPIKL